MRTRTPCQTQIGRLVLRILNTPISEPREIGSPHKAQQCTFRESLVLLLVARCAGLISSHSEECGRALLLGYPGTSGKRSSTFKSLSGPASRPFNLAASRHSHRISRFSRRPVGQEVEHMRMAGTTARHTLARSSIPVAIYRTFSSRCLVAFGTSSTSAASLARNCTPIAPSWTCTC